MKNNKWKLHIVINGVETIREVFANECLGLTLAELETIKDDDLEIEMSEYAIEKAQDLIDIDAWAERVDD